MRSTIRLVLTCVPAVLLAVSGVRAGNDTITTVPPVDMKWESTEEGVGFAPLEGERFREAYMAMVRLPAGLVSPAHAKTSNMFGVVVAGTITHHRVGTDPAADTPLPEGSYYKVPAGMAHVSTCVSDIDCVTFLYQDGRFDFLPTAP